LEGLVIVYEGKHNGVSIEVTDDGFGELTIRNWANVVGNNILGSARKNAGEIRARIKELQATHAALRTLIVEAEESVKESQ
jgi:hypothetical protein